MTVTCYPSLNYVGKEERGTESLFFSVKGGDRKCIYLKHYDIYNCCFELKLYIVVYMVVNM